MTPRQILKQYFGFTHFRPPQEEIIQTILAGRDVLALLPTGSGKSLCFQIPALILPKTTVVISPLIALMEDQVAQLQERDIAATFFSSNLTRKEQQSKIKEIRSGRWKIIYCTPERLQQKNFQSSVTTQGVSQLVIDEAHCISEWGHDFRPEYRKINEVLLQWKVRPIISAFTATATKKTANDIIASLQLHKYKKFSIAPIRTNIFLQTIPCETTVEKLLHLARIVRYHKNNFGVIYVATRASTFEVKQMLMQFLTDDVNQIDSYHGGMNFLLRSEKQKRFMLGKTKVLVATTAFGMGIDKADIRYVIHYHPPASIEQYYQEVGRAGRDRKESNAYLLLQNKDVKIVSQIHLGGKSSASMRIAKQKIRRMLRLFRGNTCFTNSIAEYFSHTLQNNSCKTCDHCSKQNTESSLTRSPTSTEEAISIKKLIAWRDAQSKSSAPYHIATDAQLLLLAFIRPQSRSACISLPGFGVGWCNQFWSSYLACMIQ